MNEMFALSWCNGISREHNHRASFHVEKSRLDNTFKVFGRVNTSNVYKRIISSYKQDEMLNIKDMKTQNLKTVLFSVKKLRNNW